MIWLSLLFSAGAADVPDQAPRFETHADLRTIGTSLSEFPLDAEGQPLSSSLWLDQRARLGAAWRPGGVELRTEWDLLTGQLAGESWAMGPIDARRRNALSLQGVVPRELAIETMAGNVLLEGGLMTSTWGMGLLANDGNQDPLFGRTDSGDRVVRLLASRLPHSQGVASPTSFIPTVALDWVVDDNVARLSDQQSAVQGIIAMVWMRRPLAKGIDPARYGIYTVFRQQWEYPVLSPQTDDRRSIQALVVDGHIDQPWLLGDSGWVLRTEAELAAIAGRTDKATTYNAREQVGLASLGAAGRVTLERNALKLHLRAGYASGDGNPDDGVSRDFSFNREFNAGMVLFDQVMSGVESATYALLTDPQIAGQPPDGVESLVTEGAIRRASFVQPVVQVAPLPWAELRAGVMMAFATAPVAQPFYTYRAGGSPTTHRDLPSSGRLLGTELDWALAVHRSQQDDTAWRPSFELQGGHLLLGPPLQGPGPSSVSQLMGVARVQW